MAASKEPIMEPFKEILMEGLSAKLKSFEDISSNYSILTNPRKHYAHASTNNSRKMQGMAKLMHNSLGSTNKLANRLNGGGRGLQKSRNLPKNQGYLKNNSKLRNPNLSYKLGNKQGYTPAAINNASDFIQMAKRGLNQKSSSNMNFGSQFSSKHSLGRRGFGGQHLGPEDHQNIAHNELMDPEGIDEDEAEVEFRYAYDFDENGALYWLGTQGKTQNYVNPYSLNQVKVFFSSMGRGSYEDFVGRALVNCRTLNEPNAFMGIDFGLERILIPSCYTIRNRDSTRHVLLNWVFEVR